MTRDAMKIATPPTRAALVMLALCAALAAAACRGGREVPNRGGNGNGDTANPIAIPAAGSRTAPPSIRHDEHVFAGGIAPPGDTMRNPFAGDAKAAKEGEQLFTSMNCDGCHGGGATGWVGPSLNDNRWRYGGSDGDIFQSIYYGRPHGMPAFGGALPAEYIWRLVAYIRSLPAPKDVPTEAW